MNKKLSDPLAEDVFAMIMDIGLISVIQSSSVEEFMVKEQDFIKKRALDSQQIYNFYFCSESFAMDYERLDILRYLASINQLKLEHTSHFLSKLSTCPASVIDFFIFDININFNPKQLDALEKGKYKISGIWQKLEKRALESKVSFVPVSPSPNCSSTPSNKI